MTIKSWVEPRSRDQPKPSLPLGHAKSRSREVSARDEAAGLKSAISSQRLSVPTRRAREFLEPAAGTGADPAARQVSLLQQPQRVAWPSSGTRRAPIPRAPVFGRAG